MKHAILSNGTVERLNKSLAIVVIITLLYDHDDR